MRILEALEKFLVQLKADGRSPHTIAQYHRHVNLLAGDLPPRRDKIEKLDHEAVARFLASPAATSRQGGGPKKATSANCLRSSIKSFLAYANRAGFITHDPGRLIRRARCLPPPPRALSEEDQRRLLAVLDNAKGSEAERDYALFHLMLATGTRIASALGLDVEDVDLQRRELVIHTAKGNQPDRVLLGRKIARHLKRFTGRRPAGPLFVGRGGERICTRHAQRRLAGWLKAAGITQPASTHSLRHTFAMAIYAKTGDLLLTKEALRHRSVSSTLVYTHVDEARLRRALQ